MIKKIYFCEVIVLTMMACSFSAVSQKQTAQEIQRERANQYQGFFSRMETVKNCSESSNGLSSKISVLREQNMPELEANCAVQNIDSVEKYESCMDLIHVWLNNIHELLTQVNEIKNTCSTFYTSQITRKLESIFRLLDYRLYYISGMHDFASKSQDYSRESYDSNFKDLYCETNIESLYKKMRYFNSFVFFASASPNLYEIQKYRKGIEVIGFQIESIAQICGLENSSAIQGSVDLAAKHKEEQENMESFSVSVAQACEKLKKKTSENAGKVCDAPVNTPSWLYAFDQVYKKESVARQ